MNDLEDRLRTAVRAEADRIEPDEATSLDTIRTRGRVALLRRRAIGGSIVALALVAAVMLSPRLADDRSQDVDLIDRPSSSTTTSTPDTTSTTPETTAATAPSTTEPPPTSQASEAPPEETAPDTPTSPAVPMLWPGPDHEPFTDPVTAARSFAAEFMGFTDPALSGFRAGGTPDQGEVDVFSKGEDGQPLDHVASTLSLQQHDGRWHVAGARAADVVIDSPGTASQVSSPLTVQGQGQGFEATIYVEVRAAFAPSGQVLDRVITAGGALDQNEPYSATLTFNASPGTTGAVVATNDTPLDNGTVSFTAVPVTFG